MGEKSKSFCRCYGMKIGRNARGASIRETYEQDCLSLFSTPLCLLFSLYIFSLPHLLIPLWRLKCILCSTFVGQLIFSYCIQAFSGMSLDRKLRNSVMFSFAMKDDKTSVFLYRMFVYLPLLLSSHLFSSSLRYITVLLASPTPAYVQLGLKGKAKLFCLWFVPAGVLSKHCAGKPLPSDRCMQAAQQFMFYQNGRVIIVFGVRGNREALEDGTIPPA